MKNAVDGIDARLKSLGETIKAHRAKLELHGIFRGEHPMTEKELRDRWNELQMEVASQLHDEKTLHGKADWLQGEIAKWVAATDLDFKA